MQRCLRTTDLDEVGDRTHLTVFEMLGSWSLGDYGSEQTLRWGYELLTEGFGIDPGQLYVTVFGGDNQVELDQESLRTWQSLGAADRADHRRQLVVERPDRSVRPGLGDLPLDRQGNADRHADHRRPLGGGVEPRDDALPPATTTARWSRCSSATSTPGSGWSG